MLPLPQRFEHCGAAMRAGLASAVRIDTPKERAPLLAHPFLNRKELPKSSINTLFTQHSSIESYRIEIFSKDCLRLVATVPPF